MRPSEIDRIVIAAREHGVRLTRSGQNIDMQAHDIAGKTDSLRAVCQLIDDVAIADAAAIEAAEVAAAAEAAAVVEAAEAEFAAFVAAQAAEAAQADPPADPPAGPPE